MLKSAVNTGVFSPGKMHKFEKVRSTVKGDEVFAFSPQYLRGENDVITFAGITYKKISSMVFIAEKKNENSIYRKCLLQELECESKECAIYAVYEYSIS